MGTVVAIRKNREQEAKAQFSNYVQSIAFNLTLSRAMIEGLTLIRDWNIDRLPMPNMSDHNATSARFSGLSRAVPLVRALERRGLVWHDYVPQMEAPKNHAYFKLTKAGELVCDLLIEAGLMLARPKKRTARAAS
jgi:hypothetical protein